MNALFLIVALQAQYPQYNPPPPDPSPKRWSATEVAREPTAQSWFSNDDYPKESRRRGEHGRVTFGMSIDTSGNPTECWIIESSGFPLLDEAACKAALARSSWTVAHDQEGTAIPYRYALRVNWEL